MDQNRLLRRFGAAVLLCALLFRLWLTGFPAPLLGWLSQPDTLSFLTYLETGRIVRFSSSEEAVPAFFRESAAPCAPEPAKPVFGAEGAADIEVTRLCRLEPDVEALLTAPLEWDLRADTSTVLITHTHTTESYTKSGETYEETSAFRTLDASFNMLCVGDRVARLLEEAGISVIHDRQIHDYPSYSGSYNHARKEIQKLLEENPGIRLVLDLHRDASGTLGKQLRTEVMADGTPCARLMLVMGTDAGGLAHENWQENLSLALKLHSLLEKQVPGIMRPLSLRSQRFNQDLSPGALLVEVGAAGNTHQEALLAAEYLARAIIALAQGST